jgi:Tfp pilus assembly protein PilO
MTRLVEDDVVEKLVVGMVFLMTGASFCNNVTEKEAEEEKKTVQYEKKGYQKVNLQANKLNIK